MNTPDESLITRWFDDELTGAELAQVEAYAAENPELLEQKREMQALLGQLRENLPAEEAVPHAEFFAARISHRIEELEAASENVTPAGPAAPSFDGGGSGFWQRLCIPFGAAAAALVVGVFLGKQAAPALGEAAPIASATQTVPVNLYTPERGVTAHIHSSEQATVIVVDGMNALPDSLDLAADESEPTFLVSTPVPALTL